MAELAVQIVILVCLLFLSGFFSGAEVALLTLTEAKLKTLLEKKRFGAKQIEKLKANPQRMLSAILIGNNIVNIAAASFMTVIMLDLFGNYAIGVATGVMTLLVLVFGEITPKTIATMHNVAVAQLVGPPIWYLSVLIRPILVVLDWVITRGLRVFGIEAVPNHITEDEIRHLVTAAEQEGSINKIEKKLIHNIFEFDETSVGEIITPRTDMVSVAADDTVASVLKLISKKRHSRIPVYDGQKDNIVGIIYLRDLLDQRRTTTVRRVMKAPYVVPEAKPIGDILRKFQRRKEHLAIVVDEHGNVTGLVTLEDVLEEIVGEIVDESETIEPNIQKEKKGWTLRGRTSITELNEQLRANIPEGEYDTLSGFLFKRLGYIPKEGEEHTYGKYTFTVLQVRKHHIAKVRARK